MNTEILFGALRHALTLIGGVLISKGWADNGTVEASVGAVIALAGFWWSRKHKIENQPPKPPVGSITGTLSIFIAGIGLLSMSTGCARIAQTVRTEITGADGVREVRTTRNHVLAIGDAKNSIEKLKVSNTMKSQSIGVAAEGNEVSLTNSLAMLEAIARILGTVK